MHQSGALLADEICSTEDGGVLQASKARQIIIATESGMLHRLQKNALTKSSFRRPPTIAVQRVPLHEDEHAGKNSLIAWPISSPDRVESGVLHAPSAHRTNVGNIARSG